MTQVVTRARSSVRSPNGLASSLWFTFVVRSQKCLANILSFLNSRLVSGRHHHPQSPTSSSHPRSCFAAYCVLALDFTPSSALLLLVLHRPQHRPQHRPLICTCPPPYPLELRPFIDNMKLYIVLALLTLLCAVVHADTPAPSEAHSNNLVKVQKQAAQKHRPLAESLGTFTEEKPPKTDQSKNLDGSDCDHAEDEDDDQYNHDRKVEADRFVSARRTARSSKPFRPNAPAVAVERANIVKRNQRLRTPKSRQAFDSNPDVDDEDEDGVESSNPDDPIIERYDV